MTVDRQKIRTPDMVRTETKPVPPALFHQSLFLAAWLLVFALPQRARAEDRVDFSYEDYAENGGRVHVGTAGLYFATELTSSFSLNGNFIYDAISGATPTGAPPLPGSDIVPMADMDDTRYAGGLTGVFKLGKHTLSPQVAYSEESDYRSLGIALNDAIDFNEKNTTLSWGLSHTFDQILPNAGEDPPSPRPGTRTPRTVCWE